METHLDMVYGICLRILNSADSARSATLEIFARLARDGRTRPSLSWMHAMAVRVAEDRVRQAEARGGGAFVGPVPAHVDKCLLSLWRGTREYLIRHALLGQGPTEIAGEKSQSREVVLERIDKGLLDLQQVLCQCGMIVSVTDVGEILAEAGRTARAPSDLAEEVRGLSAEASRGLTWARRRRLAGIAAGLLLLASLAWIGHHVWNREDVSPSEQTVERIPHVVPVEPAAPAEPEIVLLDIREEKDLLRLTWQVTRSEPLYFAYGISGIDSQDSIVDMWSGLSREAHTVPIRMAMEVTRKGRRLNIRMSHEETHGGKSLKGAIGAEAVVPHRARLKMRYVRDSVDTEPGRVRLWEGQWMMDGRVDKYVAFVLYLTRRPRDLKMRPSLSYSPLELPSMKETKSLPPDAAAAKIVDIDIHKGWVPVGWGVGIFPGAKKYSMEDKGDFMRFRVEDPGALRGWHYRMKEKISAAEYPILVIRYRARNYDNSKRWYHLWMDDGTGPASGGISPLRPGHVKDDGTIRTMRTDLRKFQPQGPLFRFVLAIFADQEPAEYDLFSIRFEEP